MSDDVTVWRDLAQRHIPNWRPTLQQLQQLDEGPHELGVALRTIARGWSRDDARWDVLLAVLEYYKRQCAHELAVRQRKEDGLERQIARVRDLHYEEYGCCEHCTGLYGVPYPCPTILALADPKAQRAKPEGDNP